jgi:hypothetical protein
MSDEPSLEHTLRELRNRIAHTDERARATIAEALDHRACELDLRAKKLLEQRVHPAAPKQRSERRVVRLDNDQADKFVADRSRLLPSGSPAVPPIGARLLLDWFLSKADRKAIPGDLKEEFAAKLREYGVGGARLWFWGETMKTIAIRNPVCRWVLVVGFGWVLRKIGG